MHVNFITEITAFYRFVKTNHLSNPAQLLWYNLFLLWNEAGFPEWLQVDNLRLMGMIQVRSKNALFRARSELLEAGLMVYRQGGNGHPNKYRFTLFGESARPGSLKRRQQEPMSDTVTEPETEPLSKPNQNKPELQKEKTAFGEFGNVWLSGEELKKLQRHYPDSWEEWIRRLDMGKAVKDYRYANDYAAILSWMAKEDREERDKDFQDLLDELI